MENILQKDILISALYLAQSDNREKMLSDLILNVLHTINEPLDIELINDFIKISFHLEPIKYELQECLNTLVEEKELNIRGQEYSLTENSKKKLYEALAKTNSVAEKRQRTFHYIVKIIFDGTVDDYEIKELWSVFNEYLLECFMIYGRKAINIFLPYEVDEIEKDDKMLQNFLTKLGNEKLVSIFKQLVIEYPEHLNDIELRYLTLLASKVEKFYSLGIEKADYDKIQSLQIKDLVILVDTNILYSILNLHSHPEKPAVIEILRIAKEKQVDIGIVYLPRTYSELRNAKNYLERLIPNESFKTSQIKALLNSGKLDPFARQYYENKLNNSKFPHPSERISYAKEILMQDDVMLHNNRFTHLEDDEAYINSKIAEYLDFQRYHNDLCDEKGYDSYLNKDEKKIEHDIFLRECIKDLKSKSNNENDLGYICLTLDRSLIRFDNYILRKEAFINSKIVNPNFISPSIFIRKIRPFIPIITNNYRKAFISSLTAPSFDKENEEDTILTQKSMSYFKSLGIEDEEIILNLIKRELFLQDFAKHEKNKTAEEFIKSEVANEIEKLKKQKEHLERQKEYLEKDIAQKEVEKSSILKERERIIEEKNQANEATELIVSQYESTLLNKNSKIESLEGKLNEIAEEVAREKEERIKAQGLADLEKKQNSWEKEKASFLSEKVSMASLNSRKAVKYFLKVVVITILPILIGIIL